MKIPVFLTTLVPKHRVFELGRKFSKKITVKTRLLRLKEQITEELGLILLLVILSCAAWLVTYKLNLSLAYNDAMSHVNISRSVIDNLQPGLAQLGGVWLPVNHLLTLLLVWNNWAWHSGFSGSIFSMLSYVISGLAIYHIIALITGNKRAALLGSIAFAINLNILYLQSTPLTESLYVVLFTLSAYIFVKWMKVKNIAYLLLLGFLGFIQVLTRYDGWFVTFFQAGVLLAYELWVEKKSLSEAFGKILLYILPVIFGIVLWLGWNSVIFGDPLYFAFGPYSAHSQQKVIEAAGSLNTKGNLFVAFSTFAFTIVHNVGPLYIFIALVGVWLFLTAHKNGISLLAKISILFLLAAPVIFNILALYLGFSIVAIPEIKKLGDGDAAQWFNVRYGIVALPGIAVCIGFLAHSKNYLRILTVLLVLILQTALLYNGGIATILDGTRGSSAFREEALSAKLKELIKPEDRVLMSVATYNPVIFKSGIQFDQIVHEGVRDLWDEALKHPDTYVDWIVTTRYNSQEIVYTKLFTEYKSAFLANFEPVYESSATVIYKRHLPESLSHK